MLLQHHHRRRHHNQLQIASLRSRVSLLLFNSFLTRKLSLHQLLVSRGLRGDRVEQSLHSSTVRMREKSPRDKCEAATWHEIGKNTKLQSAPDVFILWTQWEIIKLSWAVPLSHKSSSCGWCEGKKLLKKSQQFALFTVWMMMAMRMKHTKKTAKWEWPKVKSERWWKIASAGSASHLVQARRAWGKD